MATNHTYGTFGSNGITLHIIKTHASNIYMKNLLRKSNLKDSSYYGINGGFFNMVPVNDTTALNIARDKNGGNIVIQRSNNWNGGGAVSYSGSIVNYHSGVQDSDTISGQTLAGSWAQGGYSMHLGNINWYQLGINEIGKEADIMRESAVGRSAMLVDRTNNNVYLIVTRNSTTFTTFRTCIQQYLGITSETSSDHTRYQGVILDGSDSSQMKAKNASNQIINVTASRNLNQIIVLKNPN